MATTATTARIHSASIERELIAGKRRARIREALLGLLFVAPAAIVAITFDLFAVVYGFYLSMQGGIALPTGFVGLRHYVNALGSLAYMLTLSITLIFAIGGYVLFRRALIIAENGGRPLQETEDGVASLPDLTPEERHARRMNFYRHLVPGLITGPATLVFLGLLFGFGIQHTFLPILVIAIGIGLYFYIDARYQSQLVYVMNSWGVGFMTTASVGMALFTFEQMHSSLAPNLDVLRQVITSPSYSYVAPLLPQFIALGGIVASVAAFYFITRLYRQIDASAQPRKALFFYLLRVFILVAALAFTVHILSAQELLRGTIVQLGRVDPELIRQLTRMRMASFIESLLIWEQVFTMLLGIGLIGLAAYVWFGARRRETTSGMLTSLLIAILLMIGGWMFIGVLPTAASAGDRDLFNSLMRTFTFSALTVPIQLSIGLTLAYLLYHEVKWGKAFYRIVFFMPYIAPMVATATVFAMIFSLRETGPANQILQFFGLPPQQWLRDPRGIFEIIAQTIGGRTVRLPEFLIGPSLPLLSAILYGIWVFSGYNAVIFLAGMGNVPKEMYEAAQVDGAGRWAIFRHIIFPLISPVTFFLTVLAVIGTMKSIAHIYVLRTDAARGAMDTTTVYIYELIRTVKEPRPYAAALSFILFGLILILTIVQNRIAKDRVFYG